MTGPTSLPAARPRKILTQIAPVAWEHPADRAALQTLRSVPGFDEVVRKIYGFFGERGIRRLFQADAVRVGPTQLPLLGWFRKSELSSDRAGRLACQDPGASLRVNLKFAGGGDMSQMDLGAFLEQAKEYEEAGGALDRVFKILGVLGRSHPFNTVRAAELQRWIAQGHYERILAGEYTRRGPEAEGRPIDKDIDEARDHYMKEAKAVVNDVVDTAKRAAQA